MSNSNIVYELEDGNKYVLVDTINFDSKKYMYLVDLNDSQNGMFVIKENNSLLKVTDLELISKILEKYDDEDN